MRWAEPRVRPPGGPVIGLSPKADLSGATNLHIPKHPSIHDPRRAQSRTYPWNGTAAVPEAVGP